MIMRLALFQAPAPLLLTSFCSRVRLSGTALPACTIVSAWIDGVVYDEATATVMGEDCVYVIDVPGNGTDTVSIIQKQYNS
jgi:hypothetical protein